MSNLILDKAFNLLQFIIVPIIFIFVSVLKFVIFPYYYLLDFFTQPLMRPTTLSGIKNSLVVLNLKILPA